MFTMIKVPSEKKKILKAMLENKEPLLLKGCDDSICRLVPEKYTEESKWLTCRVTEGRLEGNDTIQEEGHIVNFSIGDERYFFQTKIQMRTDDVLLETKVDLYHLQRRKTIRMDIPEEMKATCSIINLNHFSCLHICNILDYSAGGLRLEYQAGKPGFKAKDQMVCLLKLGHRKPFEMEAEIKHCFDPAQNKGDQVFGIEFKNVSKITHNKLIALQLDLQSEIFRKWKRHQY